METGRLPEPDTLLLIGHGSTRYAEAGALLQRQADLLCAQGFQVRTAFLNGTPSVADAMAGASGPVRVVPFFMEDGYFTRVAIPRALADYSTTLCPPVGVHPGIPALIQAQAARACARLDLPPAEAALLLIGHGSSSAPGRPLALHDHARRLQASGRFFAVASACLEEAPFVADVLQGLRPRPVIAIGFFANLGLHVRDDVPALLEAEQPATGGVVVFGGTVTDDPALARLILDQAGYG